MRSWVGRINFSPYCLASVTWPFIHFAFALSLSFKLPYDFSKKKKREKRILEFNLLVLQMVLVGGYYLNKEQKSSSTKD